MSSKVITEGDRALKANVARELFNIDGAGIKVGIISTSFDTLQQASDDVISGDLPGTGNPDERIAPVQILRDLRQGSIFANDEGRAVAQIIHDIAPGAKLLFHTAIGDDGGDPSDVNDESYTKAVNALVEADVDIIFDDAQFSTSIFQDGKAAQAVQDAVSDGVVYVSAAGNNGILSYQDDYRGSNEAFSFGGKNFEAYDFDPGGNVDLFQDITVTRDGTLLLPTLTWDNPVGKVTSNLEMLLLDSPSLPGQGGNVLAVSDIPSPSAAEYPLRSLAYAPIKDRKLYLSIGRELNDAPAPDRVKWISLANGLDRTTKYQYVNDSDRETGSPTVFGPANTDETITVGATDYQQNLDAGVNLPELRSYSSRGGIPILYDEDGDPLLNPDMRSKPEVTAPDEVLTTFEAGTQFNPFRGTSASAAHIAGVVALMEQAAGGSENLSPEEIKTILQRTSIPLSPQPGVPSSTGFVQADLAVAAAELTSL